MENNKLIAEVLLQIAKNSETTFIEVSEDKELIEAASKLGLVLPSPDLAVFKTIYAEIDKVNLNGIILPKAAVEKGLPTLIGKQINFEHDGAGRICGYIIDSKINGDKIEIIGVIFKSLFPEEMESVITKFSEKKLAVSFEIWNRNPENGESVVHPIDNETRAIDPIIFHGCGLLLANPPACPKAKVYKLLAALKIEEDIKFEENLVCASMAIDEPKCNNCGTCTCGKDKEEKVMVKCEKCGKEFEPTADEKICLECASLPSEKAEEHLCPECKQPMKDDEKEMCAECLKKKENASSEENKTEEKPVETKTEEKPEVAETKTEETKVEEKKEEAQMEEVVPTVTVRKLVKIVTLEGNEITELVADAGSTISKKHRTIIIRYFNDGTDERSESEEEAIETFTYSQVEEKVTALKAEKDTEISSLKTETENLDKEIKKLKDELDKKNQEIAELKTPKVETKEEKTLTVGTVESKNQYRDINKEVDEKGFGKR